ncbi:substrate-binding periplasmic protein [Chitinimonas koreensis]|uniref:substrate-binding periplasmic protein n=1 Tax=Chitinimonas koreensis TaxID=356302 RepID=UPI00041084EC|nr:transporter substrate-binding domain-containing protein [Chitinimonas koreensis]QNM96045.1 transporter substrate-binding domain-containing protein [Chitinimonas koreensis]
MTRTAAALLLALALPARALTLYTEDYPPFNMMEAGVVSGISTLVLREGLHRAGLGAHFELLPWTRALSLARTREDSCVYSAVRTPDREGDFKWIGPLVEDHIALFARADSPIKLARIADARAYRVGGYQSDAYGDYVERQGVTLERAPADLHNLPKLRAGRIDLWVAGAISGRYRARRDGYANEIREVVRGGDPRSTQMWLACNLRLDDEVFRRLDEGVRAAIAEGVVAIYTSRYQ